MSDNFYILKGHNFDEEVRTMIQVFVPVSKFVLCDELSDEVTYVSEIGEDIATAYVYSKKEVISKDIQKIKNTEVKELKRLVKLTMFNALKKIYPREVSWGLLTGVRPSKIALTLMDEGADKNDIISYFKDKYLVRDDKIDLVMNVAERENKILKKTKDNSVSLYIGIPFCPTRCLYCSFSSYTVSQYKDKIDTYVECLKKEIDFISEYCKKYPLQSIYIGGGTPTSLNEKQLYNLLSYVDKKIPKAIEYTIEAGRPDTITKDKLRIMKDFNATRISLNPQTMNDKTLKLIGRKHSVRDFIEAFYLAKEIGHNNINTDLILGLPEENPDDIENTFKEIEKLSPENVTVHTLAVKRASKLKEVFDEYKMTDYEIMEKALDISKDYNKKMDLQPYYMYRQKNMVGNFENVGYCKEGYECIYNIQIMEEKQTIFALGAGASTKVYYPKENKLERIFNVKSVDDYINRIDEMIERKKGGLNEL